MVCNWVFHTILGLKTQAIMVKLFVIMMNICTLGWAKNNSTYIWLVVYMFFHRYMMIQVAFSYFHVLFSTTIIETGPGRFVRNPLSFELVSRRPHDIRLPLQKPRSHRDFTPCNTVTCFIRHLAPKKKETDTAIPSTVLALRHGLGFYFPWLQHKHGDTWTASALGMGDLETPKAPGWWT